MGTNWNIPFYTVGFVNWLLAGSAWGSISDDDEDADTARLLIETYGLS